MKKVLGVIVVVCALWGFFSFIKAFSYSSTAASQRNPGSAAAMDASGSAQDWQESGFAGMVAAGAISVWGFKKKPKPSDKPIENSNLEGK